MNKIALRRPFGSCNVGDIVQGIGTVLQISGQQGNSDIVVFDHGNFGEAVRQVKDQKNILPSSQQKLEEIVRQVKQSKPKKIKIAKQKGSKQVLDQTPSIQGKQLLRG